MQTFMPYSNFTKTARLLDTRRLGKQRIEAWQILMVLLGKRFSNEENKLVPAPRTVIYARHPAVLQWRGYEDLLLKYLLAIMDEWKRRGYKSHRMDLFIEKLYEDPTAMAVLAYSSGHVPPWYGNAAYHNSHKSNLLRKDPEYYGKYKWNVDPTAPYVWPLLEESKNALQQTI